MSRGTRHAPPTTLTEAILPCLHHLTAEHRLWLAVLEQALRDLASKRHRPRALAWIGSCQTAIGSLAWIAAELGLSLAAIRRAVRRGIVLPREHAWSRKGMRVSGGRRKPLARTRRNTVR